MKGMTLMIDLGKIYLITEIAGYTPKVSHLISMLNYARFTTLEATEAMSMEQLDYLLDENSNSIGALLLHFAAVEVAYQAATFEGRGLTDEEMKEWGPALNLGNEGRSVIRGHELNYYIERLAVVRQKTLERFRTVDDRWLEQEETFWHNKPANYYFMWFHVLEDEINHRGQIRIIRKRAEQG